MRDISHRDGAHKPPCRLRALPGQRVELTGEQIGELAGECEAHRADLEAQNEELRALQQKLEGYRDRYVDLYDFAPLGYVTLDEDGYVQEINLAGATMLTAERDGLIGYPFADFVAPSDRDRFLQHVRDCTRGRQEVTAEIALVAKDGRNLIVQLRSLPLSDDPLTTFCKTAMTDISERHRAESACRDAETRLRFALGAAEMGVWQWDMAADRLTCDERGNALMGLAPGVEMNFKMVFEIIHPDDHQQAVAQLMEAQATPGDYESEFRARWPDGSIHWIFVRGRSTRDADGRVRLTGVSMEITERKEFEETLLASKVSAERAKAAAEEANRIKDHFLTVLSHELRTPLTPVVMGVDLLLARGDLPPEARRTLEMIGRNAEMEARLIDDLLDISRIARGKIELEKQHVEVGAVLQRAVEVCRPEIEVRGLQFGIDLGPAATYWIEGDPARLQQVFWNLLKNAIKFTPPGGCVGVQCRAEGETAVVEVSDSGIGIEPADIPRVFHAFEQSGRAITREFGGLGMGLAICKALVELHAGTIDAQSEGRDKGATFRVRLPLSKEQGAPSKKQAASPCSLLPAPCALRILLVEDHRVTADIVRTVLVQAGHSVELADDVSSALRLADAHEFDLLMSDLGLPDGSGHDLLNELRSRGRNFPAVALSGFGREEDIERSYEAGFAAHLTKPASRDAVVAAVAYAMTAATVPTSA